MKIVVLKFGGSSVGSIQRIKNVAKIVISYLKNRYRLLSYLLQWSEKQTS